MSVFAEPINWPATIAFGLVCFGTGGLFGVYIAKLRRPRQVLVEPPREPLWSVDDDAASVIDDAARDWARRERRTDMHADIASSYAKIAVNARRRGGQRR